MRNAICCLFLSLAVMHLACPAAGGQGWYAGDICLYPARNTATVIPERVQQGMEAGLDWLVLSGNFQEGLFTGLRDVLQEYDLNTPRITPIMGTGWALPGETENALILFGMDPRAPVPRDSLWQAVIWAESHNGISILARPDRMLGLPPPQWQTATAFMGVHNGEWHPACEPGGAWDRLLTEGHRIFLVGGSNDLDKKKLGRAQKTYVWAESPTPEGVIMGLHCGAVYVAGADGIHMDLLVNGRPPGTTVPVAQDAYVRLRAAARYPISRVLLIADGEAVWAAQPDTTIWEARFFLPLINRSYVRVILESEAGGCRTMGSPVFLMTDAGDGSGEIPQEESHRPFSEAYLEVDGALETLAKLPPHPQRTILSEYLRDVRMRYATVWALQNREDLIPIKRLDELMQHTDPQVRLGAAYALAVRMPAELSRTLLRLMQDNDARVREYAARMLLQYTEGVGNTWIAGFLEDPHPAVQMYLIRALSAARFDPQLTGKLISASRSIHPGVASAALDKLSEMGTVNFRVIQALIDSGRAGNPHALEAIGWIGEHRSIPDLEDIYRSVPYGPVRRASFLALEKMGAPYYDKRKATCAWIARPPQIDGRLDPGEWEAATSIREFSTDWDGSPIPGKMMAHIARDSARFYLAIICEAPDTLAPIATIDTQDSDLQGDGRVECAFWTSDGKEGFRIFAVNPLGVHQDRKDEDRNWNPQWETAGYREPGRWILESAIPLSDIGLEAHRFPAGIRFNLSLVGGGSSSHRWTWSVTYGGPDNPNRLGDLAFDLPPAEQGDLEKRPSEN